MTDNTPLMAPGGAIDPKYAHERDVFLNKPADAAASPAYKLAETYVERVRAGDFAGMAELFTEDAIVFPPLRAAPAVGREAIRHFYQNTIGKIAPKPVAVSIFGEGRECYMELSVQLEVDGEPRWALTTIDHFTLADNGLFSRMVVYVRP